MDETPTATPLRLIDEQDKLVERPADGRRLLGGRRSSAPEDDGARLSFSGR
jgi:hypothetical protein